MNYILSMLRELIMSKNKYIYKIECQRELFTSDTGDYKRMSSVILRQQQHIGFLTEHLNQVNKEHQENLQWKELENYCE